MDQPTPTAGAQPVEVPPVAEPAASVPVSLIPNPSEPISAPPAAFVSSAPLEAPIQGPEALAAVLPVVEPNGVARNEAQAAVPSPQVDHSLPPTDQVMPVEPPPVTVVLPPSGVEIPGETIVPITVAPPVVEAPPVAAAPMTAPAPLPVNSVVAREVPITVLPSDEPARDKEAAVSHVASPEEEVVLGTETPRATDALPPSLKVAVASPKEPEPLEDKSGSTPVRPVQKYEQLNNPQIKPSDLGARLEAGLGSGATAT